MLRVSATTPFREFNSKWTGPHQVIPRIGQSHVYVITGEARANTTSIDSVLRLHKIKNHHARGEEHKKIISPSGAQQLRTDRDCNQMRL
ncbi:hypothetical protein MTP99_002812 [Tenebrio molitor]|nr:hypothetical protein MTP99_002812 [Tenebrio molitor]